MWSWDLWRARDDIYEMVKWMNANLVLFFDRCFDFDTVRYLITAPDVRVTF